MSCASLSADNGEACHNEAEIVVGDTDECQVPAARLLIDRDVWLLILESSLVREHDRSMRKIRVVFVVCRLDGDEG